MKRSNVATYYQKRDDRWIRIEWCGCFILYDEGHSVFSHVDGEGVHMEDMPWHDCYAVAKLDRESIPSIFGHCFEDGETGANCCWINCDPESGNYRGHKKLRPG